MVAPQGPGQNPAVRPMSANKRINTLYGAAPAGRPPSNLGRYLLRPTPEVPDGIEMMNTNPDLLETVQKKYLSMYQLPPALQPKYLRKPQVLETRRGQAISKGWRNPRSLHK